MNPSDANSPLATLRQLREMLDAGTLSPAEFEALKKKLVFGPAEAPGPTAPAAPPAIPAPAEPAATSASTEPAVTSTTSLPTAPPTTPAPPAEIAPTTAAAPKAPIPNTQHAIPDYPVAPATSASPDTPDPDAALANSPEWLAATAPNLLAAVSSAPLPTTPLPEPAPSSTRTPLTLIFAIGGTLLLLAVMGYLLFGLPPKTDEHLTSKTLTAQDTTAVAPAVGPQAPDITLPPVAPPETVRVAPPPPPRSAAAGQFAGDSAKPTPATPKPDPKPAATPAAPAPADSAGAPVGGQL